MKDTEERERQRHRQREKQAPCREPDVGLDPGTLGSRPGPKADAQPLSHPGVPGTLILKASSWDPWVAQWFGACLAQGMILETQDQVPCWLPAWSLLLPLPVSLPLSLSLPHSHCLSRINKQNLKKENQGCLGGSVVEHLPLAQGVILESQDRVPHWAPCMEPASSSACVSAVLCLS